MKAPRGWRSIALAALCASCSDDSSDSQAAPIPTEEFPRQFASAWCAWLERCCEASGGTSDGACEDDTEARMAQIGSEAAAADATWDDAAAGRCLDRIRAADCGGDLIALRDTLDACDDMWRGRVPPGGACETYAACAEPDVDGDAQTGVGCINSECVQIVRQPAGAPCMATLLRCDPLLAECDVSGICVALPDVGDDCSDSCRAGARCDEGTCVALADTGEDCSVESDCSSEDCNAGRCTTAGIADSEYCSLP
jgi:hypothetical protein